MDMYTWLLGWIKTVGSFRFVDARNAASAEHGKPLSKEQRAALSALLYALVQAQVLLKPKGHKSQYYEVADSDAPPLPSGALEEVRLPEAPKDTEAVCMLLELLMREPSGKMRRDRAFMKFAPKEIRATKGTNGWKGAFANALSEAGRFGLISVNSTHVELRPVAVYLFCDLDCSVDDMAKAAINGNRS